MVGEFFRSACSHFIQAHMQRTYNTFNVNMILKINSLSIYLFVRKEMP